ncbi:MAG TPA: DUF4105 domain-containing protein [Gemmatimonadota bacterium]|nr:DUF4105 domain-containing protein [Gemmatimonadota bacterium]
MFIVRRTVSVAVPLTLLICLPAGRASHAAAQELALPALSDSVRVSLISILPGSKIYSVFGHSALRIRDPLLGIDSAYNFGTFDFGDAPLDVASFVARFTYGDLNYSLAVQDPPALVRWYWENERRASVEQTLALTRDEAQELFERLQVNALPENRYYQYDFFFDNCATRLLDVLEAVLGERLTFEADPAGRSFRRLLDPYLVGTRWVDLGMDLGLGLPADREATAREATFLPEHLMDYLAVGSVDRGENGRQPLVRHTVTLTGPAGASWKPETDAPWPEIVGWALLAVGVFFTMRDARTGRRARPVADGLFFGALGAAGLAVTFLWFVSLHDVTDLNFNLAWALPTHLALAFVLARGRAEDGASGRRAGFYLAATAALAGMLLLGIPLWPQELPAALVPLLLLIVARAGWLARARLG